ncbi:MAG TPA: hypothetical protein DDW76_25895 [Cyanobacteria bacterium UBA11369]|nr:hypothetical protein [Cyanobacteria bacterium UBA11371]HBE19189.1 hypothetical protein [Cyanobacteria bacterium UBA11367]HBE34908.1 hypothetical protein [Cyanobacteria bacterium UBA11368]HBE52109.1 hypothetical protein [Cyanobacteria bacterium UBA11369]
MLIEDYFQEVRDIIEACSVVQLSNVNYDSRSIYRGFMRGELKFLDGSVLYLREFVDVKTTIVREMYSYHYENASKKLIFRYDNTRHHKKLNLPNYPHHKHDGSEDNVISSNAPMLAEVLNEIARLLG